jgi:hypothetical protein
MATRYEQFAKVRRRYGNQPQLRVRSVTAVAAASASVNAVVSLTQYRGYTGTRAHGGGRGGYSIP